jgi:CubicO group peptidase (beta-lactamase class C family)
VTKAAPFPKSAPEAQQIRSSAILAFVEAVERDVRDLHSFMLLRRGSVVAQGYWEPYGRDHPHMLFSLSKSFTSTAIGLLVAEGRLSVENRVLDYFPGEGPAQPGDNLRAMRVRDLLTMTTGHDTDATGALHQTGKNWTRAFLAQPVEHQPGTHFVYNSAATYMLSAIAQRLTGERILDYLQPRLFAPLGITHPTWETSPEGIDVGGWGLAVTTADIARFGQLYLQKGVWQGQRLLPEAWVAEATSRQVPNGPNENPDWEQGYGYQFWRCRHRAYRGDGAFGQFCVIMPDQEAVLAVTAGLSNMQAVLDLVWKHLLPAMGSVSVPDDSATASTLDARLAVLRLAPAAGRATSSRAAELTGRDFTLVENSDQLAAIRFDFEADGCAVTLRDGRGEQRIQCGFGRWVQSDGTTLRAREFGVEGPAATKLVASGAWLDDRTYLVELCWYETPFRRTLTCRFDGDRVVVDQQANVSFGPVERPRLEGKATPSRLPVAERAP